LGTSIRMDALAVEAKERRPPSEKEAISSYTTDLSNACNACHRVYRDVGGRGRGGPGNNLRALHAPISHVRGSLRWPVFVFSWLRCRATMTRMPYVRRGQAVDRDVC
jgi:hypothetical protein